MIREPFEWELPENDKYFQHTRNNGNNYYDPESWDISPDAPQHLIDLFNETMKHADYFNQFG